MGMNTPKRNMSQPWHVLIFQKFDLSHFTMAHQCFLLLSVGTVPVSFYKVMLQ